MRCTKLLVALSTVAALLGITMMVATPAPASTANVVMVVPACGPDPVVNTKAVQAAVDAALPGDTVLLPAGTCVLAKCDLVTGKLCYGAAGVPHRSAVHIGNRSGLTIEGRPGGTSVLKLDPNPPGTPGHHLYCGAANLLSIVLSQGITLRGFTVDGSNAELPRDNAQCPLNPRDPEHSGRLDEHLHDIAVANSTDVVVDRMRVTQAHGDGLNLFADRTLAARPATEHVTVTGNEFLGNGRAGVTFQRNVGYATLSHNHFLDSGNDQDLDMEPTGGPDDRGPYEVTIDGNDFERLQAKIAVTLGATGGIQPSHAVRFTDNVIRPSALADPATGEGGCIGVYQADDTTIAGNTVIGARVCPAIAAQRATRLKILDNHVEGYANGTNSAGTFQPTAVIDVVERIVNQGDTNVCGGAPRPPCPYGIHYPEDVTIAGNTVVQHVATSLGIRLSNNDPLAVTGNEIIAAGDVAAAGPLPKGFRSTGIEAPLGERDLPSYGFYVNEKTQLKTWTITGNGVRGFADGIHLRPAKPGVGLTLATISGNELTTPAPGPRGIVLDPAPGLPDTGWVGGLTVDANRFGCGFAGPLLPPAAYVRPGGQAHAGSIGSQIPCT